VPEIHIAFDHQSVYIAELIVHAAHISGAKESAIERVEEFLALMATRGNGYRVAYSGVLAEQILPRTDATVSIGESGEKIICLNDLVEGSEQISLVKKQVDFDFEIKAINCRNQWPDWLKTVIKLNYLAVLSHDIEPRFIVMFSALEVLTEAIHGASPTILKGELEPDKAEIIKAEVKNILCSAGLSDSGVRRLLSRLTDTQAMSKIDTVVFALGQCSIDAEVGDVRLVVKQRGAVVHAGRASTSDDLIKAVNLVCSWVQAAIRNVMNTKQWVAIKKDSR